MLYLAMMDITKKWTGHRQDWGQIHSQLEIFFEERLSGNSIIIQARAEPQKIDSAQSN